MGRSRDVAKLAKDIDDAGNFIAEAISSDVTLGGATIYSTRSALPGSGNTSGDQAFVTDNSRLYIWNGNGWYNVALLNLAPSITSVQDSDGNTTPFTLATDGTVTTITVTAVDSDGDPFTYDLVADSDFAGLGTIVQDGSEFTITPLSEDSATTESGTITFTASDGINVGTSGVQTFTLTFGVQFTDDFSTNTYSDYIYSQNGGLSSQSSFYNSPGEAIDIIGADNGGHIWFYRTSSSLPSTGTLKLVMRKTRDYPSDNSGGLVIGYAPSSVDPLTVDNFLTDTDHWYAQLPGSAYSGVLRQVVDNATVVSVNQPYKWDDQASYHTFELYYTQSQIVLYVDGTSRASLSTSQPFSKFNYCGWYGFQIDLTMTEFSITDSVPS